MLSSGVVISDRYRLDEHLATGGMGEVWRATDDALGRTVAVKVLLPSLLADPGFGARFRAEARMLAALRHPGVVDVYDCGEDALPGGGRVLYLVMEYVDGEPLSRRITADGRLDPHQTLSLVAQAAEALHAAHEQGIVHRDVKPSNLLVRPDGTLKLVDFGVARSAAVTSLTGTNAIIGTALYMAPEQARGLPVSPAIDIYALGAVAYHCLAGRPPFPGDNPLHVAMRHLSDAPEPLPDDVPAPVAALVERALAKDPAGRHPDAAALAADARAVLAGQPISPADPGGTRVLGPTGGPPAGGSSAATGAPAPRTGRRRAALTAAAAAVVGLAGLAGALASAPWAEAPTQRHPAPATSSAAPRAEQPAPAAGDGAPAPHRNVSGERARPTGSPEPSPRESELVTPEPTATPDTPEPTPEPSAPSATDDPEPTPPDPPPATDGPDVKPVAGTATADAHPEAARR